MTAAWKHLELRVCRALGGGRAGPLGASTSDCVGVPRFSVECKRSNRDGPPVMARWILQAKTNATREGKRHNWLLVVAGHNSRRLQVTLDFHTFCEIAQAGGYIPTPVVVELADMEIRP